MTKSKKFDVIIKAIFSSCLVLFCFLTAGCADLKAHSIQADLKPIATTQRVSTLDKDVTLSLPGGLEIRKLKAGIRFEEIGIVSQGRVWRPINTIVTVETGASSHEAYPVTADGVIVGVFLPVEELFLKANVPVSSAFKEKL